MYKMQTLKNGIRLITVPMKGTETVTSLIMVSTGSKYENQKNNGISHFLEHMFFKGTAKRPNTLVLSSELDTLGGVYNAFTTKEFTGYWTKTDSRHTEQSVEILSDMLLHSKFDPEEIKREKGVIIEELNMYRDNPMIYIEDVFENLLYGDQPAGWDIIGTKENILSFKRSDFLSYIKNQYGAQNMVVCLAGNLKTEPLNLVKKYLGGLQPTKPNKKLAVQEKQIKPEIRTVYKKTDQTHLSLGVRTFSSGHKDEFILKILSIVLGGSMSSRLFINLREREGLAYYVRTSTEFYTDTGYLTTQAGVPVDKVEKAIKIILAEYDKLKNESVSPDELSRIKDMIKGKLVIQLESSDNQANWYARQVIMKEQMYTPKDYLTIIDSINPDDIKKVANDVFANNKLNLAIIGPYKDNKDFKNILTF